MVKLVLPGTDARPTNDGMQAAACSTVTRVHIGHAVHPIHKLLHVALALGMLLGTPASEAQQAPRVARIAFLSTTASLDSPTTTAFRQGLQELGYVQVEHHH
jgi:hypothetical protein